jgi:hypothetical protein
LAQGTADYRDGKAYTGGNRLKTGAFIGGMIRRGRRLRERYSRAHEHADDREKKHVQFSHFGFSCWALPR